MLFRTHFIGGLFLLLLFFSFVENRILFFLFGFFGIILPDLDTKNSLFGRKIIFRPVQFFLNHRGISHTLILGIVIALIISFFIPAGSVGFFIGFSSHIILDSFTKEGVSAFFPIKKRSHGFIETGSFFENILFYILLFADVLIILYLLISYN